MAGYPGGSVFDGRGADQQYSVPIRFIGRPVRILLHASWLVVCDCRTEIARHERLIGKALTRVELDHYLEAMIREPGAMAGATALQQARQSGKFAKATTRGGPRSARPTASATAPARSSKFFCCTAACPTSRSSPAWMPRCALAR
ncbi:Mu transposase domain-containing protein [Nocardia tenerifensis]|uniref:Mu transposase domain-containing protein n=1 Tax=Nocardia tenerifensis TaxID=228006 RepID=UPI001FEB6B1B|nr:hypothetical protein [Nocardia tenerifensis]